MAGRIGPAASAFRGRPALAIALALVAAFWVALWIRLDSRSVMTRVPVLDEAFYMREAGAIAGGRILPDGPFVMSPLYPYIVAVSGGGREFDEAGVRRGPAPYSTRVLQAVLWGATLVLLYRAAARLLDRAWAWLPPLLFALYAPAAVFVTTTLLEIPFVFCVTATLVLLTPGRDGAPPAAANSWRWSAGTGLLVGAATLLRPTAILLLLPAAVTLAGRRRSATIAPRAAGKRDAAGPRREAAGRTIPAGRSLAGLTAGALVVLLPVFAFNTLRAGHPAGVSLNGGLNFYLGEAQGADGLFRTFSDLQAESDPAGVAFLAGRLGRPVSGAGEADRIWWDEAWTYVAQHPARALLLWAKKVWLHFTAFEIDPVTPLSTWRRDAPLLRLLIVPYGLLAALGLAGLALVGLRPPWRTWTLTLVLIVAAQSLFFVVSRYRLVLVPMLALLATTWAREMWRRRGRARLLPAALAVVGGLAVVPWGLGPQRSQKEILARANEARRWARLGDPSAMARAESLYGAALAADSSQTQLYQGLARVMVRRGREDAAEAVLAEGAHRLGDQAAPLERDLAMLQMDRGEYKRAAPRLMAYVRERPVDAEALRALCEALANTGRADEGAEVARRLVALRPEDPGGYLNLGALLARAGRHDEAKAAYTAGLQRAPGDAALRQALAALDAAPALDTAPQGDGRR